MSVDRYYGKKIWATGWPLFIEITVCHHLVNFLDFLILQIRQHLYLVLLLSKPFLIASCACYIHLMEILLFERLKLNTSNNYFANYFLKYFFENKIYF